MSQQQLETRSFACRATLDSAVGRAVRLHGTAILFEQWQRVATAGQAAWSGSGGSREKVTKEALRIDVSDQKKEFVHKVKALVTMIHRSISVAVQPA